MDKALQKSHSGIIAGELSGIKAFPASLERLEALHFSLQLKL